MNKPQYYANGWYSVPAPPVATYQWAQSDWIAFIDQSGKWTKPALKKRYGQALGAVTDGKMDCATAADKYEVSARVLSHGIEYFNLKNGA